MFLGVELLVTLPVYVPFYNIVHVDISFHWQWLRVLASPALPLTPTASQPVFQPRQLVGD